MVHLKYMCIHNITQFMKIFTVKTHSCLKVFNKHVRYEIVKNNFSLILPNLKYYHPQYNKII